MAIEQNWSSARGSKECVSTISSCSVMFTIFPHSMSTICSPCSKCSTCSREWEWVNGKREQESLIIEMGQGRSGSPEGVRGVSEGQSASRLDWKGVITPCPTSSSPSSSSSSSSSSASSSSSSLSWVVGTPLSSSPLPSSSRSSTWLPVSPATSLLQDRASRRRGLSQLQEINSAKYLRTQESKIQIKMQIQVSFLLKV